MVAVVVAVVGAVALVAVAVAVVVMVVFCDLQLLHDGRHVRDHRIRIQTPTRRS